MTEQYRAAVEEKAERLGWDRNEGEGALEFLMRSAYEAGVDDTRKCRNTHNEPPQALLISMAVRFNHGFGLLDHAQQQSLLRDMKKVWEEVVGLGFYRADRADFYTSMVKEVK